MGPGSVSKTSLPVLRWPREAAQDAPPRGPLPPPRPRLLRRLHAPRQGRNHEPQPPTSPGTPSSMAPSRLRRLLIGTAAASSSSSSIPAFGSVTVSSLNPAEVAKFAAIAETW
nr:unnamed protein product [Digitaria exilis]